ncbi:MAG: DUF1385 domain-containing protein [Oscillospiraceae bacterium]|jgi:uncharacterized protein YqhQ|nr:DUF1385 domain-containing protein [Oscillospiraceae bacterium]
MPKKPEKPDIGGQAVLEGVMMKAPDAIAIAVRKPNGRIAVRRDRYTPLSEKHPWMGWPVVRGIINMATMLAMGMNTLDKSAQMLGTMDEEPSRFEKWLSEKLGKSIDKVIMAVAIVMAVGLALLLFMVIPSFIGTLINRAVDSLLLVNLISGVVRIGILIGYIGLTGLIPDMRRTFQYHGAEHKTIYCHEAGQPLTPENAQKYSTLHPRCGTSFLLLVMIIAVLLGAVSDQLLHLIFGVERLSFLGRLARSVVLLPLIAGISYEALKSLAHSNNLLVRALRWPGLMLQKLTTREPSLEQLEVAIAAFKAAAGGAEGTVIAEGIVVETEGADAENA